MKWQVEIKVKLLKWHFHDMANWWNGKLKKCKADDMSMLCWWNDKMTECSVDEKTWWWNPKLMNWPECQVYEMTK